MFHNCSDYTDALLDVADVNGMFAQIMLGGDSLISIPVIRELETSWWAWLDSGIKTTSDALLCLGESMSDEHSDLGDILIETSKYIDFITDFIGNIGGLARRITGDYWKTKSLPIVMPGY